jgi:hypothetical protein
MKETMKNNKYAIGDTVYIVLKVLDARLNSQYDLRFHATECKVRKGKIQSIWTKRNSKERSYTVKLEQPRHSAGNVYGIMRPESEILSTPEEAVQYVFSLFADAMGKIAKEVANKY